MRIEINIDNGKEDDTIADGAGRIAADLLRNLAERVEIGGVVSGPLWDRRTEPLQRIGSFSFEISRERV